MISNKLCVISIKTLTKTPSTKAQNTELCDRETLVGRTAHGGEPHQFAANPPKSRPESTLQRTGTTKLYLPQQICRYISNMSQDLTPTSNFEDTPVKSGGRSGPSGKLRHPFAPFSNFQPILPLSSHQPAIASKIYALTSCKVQPVLWSCGARSCAQ